MTEEQSYPPKGNGKPENNRKETGQFAPGHSGNLGGRPKGVPNISTAIMRERAQEFLSRPEYLEKLKTRIDAGQAQSVEILLYHYAWGRPKETVELKGETQRPFQIVLRGPLRDPLEVEGEPVDHPERKLPALPTEMREIGFDLNLEDLDPSPDR